MVSVKYFSFINKLKKKPYHVLKWFSELINVLSFLLTKWGNDLIKKDKNNKERTCREKKNKAKTKLKRKNTPNVRPRTIVEGDR